MNISLSHLLLLLATLAPLTLTCSEVCTELSYYSCTVCLSECVAEETYSYGSCKEKYCSKYETQYYYDNNRKRKSKKVCVQYDYYVHSQAMCITSCCGDVGLGVSTFEGGFLKQCMDENDRLLTQVGIIIGCVIGGLALIIIGGILFYKWRKNKSQEEF